MDSRFTINSNILHEMTDAHHAYILNRLVVQKILIQDIPSK